jgi:hypothetical protein
MPNETHKQPTIVQIAAVAMPGEKRTFVNLYGLEAVTGRIWQWEPTDAAWRPFKIEKKSGGSW